MDSDLREPDSPLVRKRKRKWKKVKVLVPQSFPALCDPMDCSPPGSSVYGIFQARIMEWVAISFSRGYSWLRDQTQPSCIAGRFFTVWATREEWLPIQGIDESNWWMVKRNFLSVWGRENEIIQYRNSIIQSRNSFTYIKGEKSILLWVNSEKIKIITGYILKIYFFIEWKHFNCENRHSYHRQWAVSIC